jgi:hypothetical protein
MTGSPPGTVGQQKKTYCMLEYTLKRKSGTARRVKAHQGHEKWNIMYFIKETSQIWA